MTRIRIVRDHVDFADDVDPVVPGTIIENAYITNGKDAMVEPGEAWYNHPVADVPWFSVPADFEVVS
jgi:hypothetical protein